MTLKLCAAFPSSRQPGISYRAAKTCEGKGDLRPREVGSWMQSGVASYAERKSPQMCPVNSAVSECLFRAPNKDSCVRKCGCATNVNYRLTASRSSTALIQQSKGVVTPGR